MSVQYQAYRIEGEPPEGGSLGSLSEGGILNIREVIKREDGPILSGEVLWESTERFQTLEEKPENQYHIRLDSNYNIGLEESEDENQIQLDEKTQNQTESVPFTIVDDLFLSPDLRPHIQFINEISNMDLSLVSIDRADSEEILELFENTTRAMWQNIDENTSTASISGTIEESEYTLDQKGDLSYIIGNARFGETSAKIGISTKNPSVIVYSEMDRIRSAEIAAETFKTLGNL